MVSTEADHVLAAHLQAENGIDDPPYIRAAVEVIAYKDKRVGDRIERNPIEELLQSEAATVDVSNGQYLSRHGGISPERFSPIRPVLNRAIKRPFCSSLVRTDVLMIYPAKP